MDEDVPVKPTPSLARLLPVVFVCSILITLYTIYLEFHCFELLQVDINPKFRDPDAVVVGAQHAIMVSAISFMILWSLYQTHATDPGRVPTAWKELPTDVDLLERKEDGSYRYCKVERVYKPDRAHLCRQLNRNVLKMDHYCPWVANCVGFYNYKYFFLSLFYSSLGCLYIACTTIATLEPMFEAINVTFNEMFYNFLNSMLSLFIFCISAGLLSFHMWLIANNKSTLEFCEKRKSNAVSYDVGLWKNVTSVMGFNPFLWLLPVSGPVGDGLSFPVANPYKRDYI